MWVCGSFSKPREILLHLYSLLADFPVLSGGNPKLKTQPRTFAQPMKCCGSGFLTGNSRAESSGSISFSWELLSWSCHVLYFSLYLSILLLVTPCEVAFGKDQNWHRRVKEMLYWLLAWPGSLLTTVLGVGYPIQPGNNFHVLKTCYAMYFYFLHMQYVYLLWWGRYLTLMFRKLYFCLWNPVI